MPTPAGPAAQPHRRPHHRWRRHLDSANHAHRHLQPERHLVHRSEHRLGLRQQRQDHPHHRRRRDLGRANQRPGTAALSAIDFVDPSNGWVTGTASSLGLVRHTTDGGVTWTAQTLPVTAPAIGQLYSLDFADVFHGWVCGAAGVIAATTDGGATWTAQTSGVSTSLSGCCALTANAVWAVGAHGTMLSTTTGGGVWTARSTCVTVSDLLGAAFVSDTPAGSSATAAPSLPPPTVADLDSANQRRDQQPAGGLVFGLTEGWAVGYNGAVLTSRRRRRELVAPEQRLHDHSPRRRLRRALSGWVTGNSAANALTIAHTTDGGQNWTPQSAGTGLTQLNAIDFCNADNGIAVGNLVSGAAAIRRTTNGGGTWTLSTAGKHGQSAGCGLPRCHARLGRRQQRHDSFSSANGGQRWNSRRPAVPRAP